MINDGPVEYIIKDTLFFASGSGVINSFIVSNAYSVLKHCHKGVNQVIEQIYITCRSNIDIIRRMALFFKNESITMFNISGPLTTFVESSSIRDVQNLKTLILLSQHACIIMALLMLIFRKLVISLYQERFWLPSYEYISNSEGYQVSIQLVCLIFSFSLRQSIA